MDVRKVISAIVVAVVLLVGATVAYMYIADVGVFSDKNKEKEDDLESKDSKMGEFGKTDGTKGNSDNTDGGKEVGKSDDDVDVDNDGGSDSDKNSDIVSALPEGEEDGSVEISDVKVTEGKDGRDKVTASTGNGNSVDVFVPGQNTNSEPVVSTDKPKEEDRELVSSGDNKYTDKVKNDVIKAGAVYIGESDGSFGVFGDGITHSFSIDSVDNYKFSYLITREDSSESLKLAISNMIKLGVGVSESDLYKYVNKSINDGFVDVPGVLVVSDGIATVVRWS